MSVLCGRTDLCAIAGHLHYGPQLGDSQLRIVKGCLPQTPSYLLSQILRHCMASLCFAVDTLRPNSLLVYTEALRAPMRTHTDSNNHLSTHCKQHGNAIWHPAFDVFLVLKVRTRTAPRCTIPLVPCACRPSRLPLYVTTPPAPAQASALAMYN